MFLSNASEESIGAGPLAWIAPAVQSAAVLPVILDNQWIGVVGIGHTKPDALLPAGPATLPPLAHQLALTVANGRRQMQLSASLREQSALNALNQSLNQADDFDEVESLARANIGEFFDIPNWYLAVLNHDGSQVAFRPFVESGQARALKPQAPEGVIQHILVTRRPLLLMGDMDEELGTLGLPNRSSGARLEPGNPVQRQSLPGPALLAGDEPVGVIALEDRRNPDTFDENNTRLLAALAAQLAATIRRIRALQQMQAADQRAAELNDLYEQASRAIQLAQQDLVERNNRWPKPCAHAGGGRRNPNAGTGESAARFDAA